MVLALYFTGHCQTLPQTPSPQKSPSATAGGLANSQSECGFLEDKSAQLIAKEDYATASDVLTKAAAVCPDSTTILLKLSRAQMLSHQFDAAETSIDKLLKIDPKNPAAVLTSGELAYLMDDDAKAEKAFLQTIQLTPQNPEPHYLLGRLYFQQVALQKAQKQFQAALALDANWYKAYDGLGLCYASNGDTKSAIDAYMKGVSLVYKDHPPQSDVLYADFAELLLKLGSNQQAFNLAAEAADINPRAPRNYFLAGKALEQAGDLSRSLAWLNRAATIDPNYPDPHYFLARIYRRMGQKEKARQQEQTFQDLLAKAPVIRR